MVTHTQLSPPASETSDWWPARYGAGDQVRPGDAVFFHTGWGQLWGTESERYAAGEPGPGRVLGEWLADHRVALTGCDTWSFGPYPPEDPQEPFAGAGTSDDSRFRWELS